MRGAVVVRGFHAKPGSKPEEDTEPLVDAKVKEFLRYILSRQGQQDVAQEGGYLPLTPERAGEQRVVVENPPTGRVFRKDRRSP